MGVLTVEQRKNIVEDFTKDCRESGWFQDDWWTAVEGYDVNIYDESEGEENGHTKIILYPIDENGKVNYSDYFTEGYLDSFEVESIKKQIAVKKDARTN